MKQALLFIIKLVVFSGVVYAQDEDTSENYIFWSEDYQLVWTDFEGPADSYSTNAAFSVIGFDSRLDYDDHEYRAFIKVFFDKNESWARVWTDILLKHEQGHFDIAEIAARKFRKKVQEKMQAGAMTEAVFRMLSDETMQELQEAQERYDKATNFSIDYDEQMEWSERIKNRLFEFSAYSDHEIIIKR